MSVTTIYRPYRPSNGTEGMYFEAKFCERCAKNDPEKGCDIQARAFWHQIDDPEYPKEWIARDKPQDDLDDARCTAFERKV